MRQHGGMFFRFVLNLSLLAILSSCAVSGSGFDLNHWREEKIRLSQLELTFHVPGGQSDAAPPLPTIRYVDLDQDFSSEKPGFPVYDHTWKVDQGPIKGNMGSFNFIVSVARRSGDYASEFISSDNLEAFIRRQLDRTYTERNARLRREGKQESVVEVPKDYKRINIRGREWLVYTLFIMRGMEQTFYATAVTPNHVLRAITVFVDNTRGYKSNWRQQAQEVADKIMASVEIR